MVNQDYSSQEIFSDTIDGLKEFASKAGIEITDEDIASKLNISLEDFFTYYRTNVAPDDIFPLLREKFNEFIGSYKVERIWFSVEHEVDDPEVPPTEEE